MTELFVVASRLGAEIVAGAVPPSCRRGVDAIPEPRIDGADCVVEAEWSPRCRARHFVPSVSILAARSIGFRTELAVETDGAWTPWVAATSIGPSVFPPMPAVARPLSCDIDVFVSSAPAARVRLRVRLRRDDAASLMDLPWLAALSVSDLGSTETPPERAPSPPIVDAAAIDDGPSAALAARVADRVALDVPSASQMVEAELIRHRICSPTSVAMVLGRWGLTVAPAALAGEVFHAERDVYGIWPAAIAAAARRGIAGYLLRFPDWESAAWCLANGLPIVASVRYTRGELAGAAITETDGHLLVLTGYEGDDVLVNDPAAPSNATVARRHRRDEIERVWLGRSGVGYVFFPPGPRSSGPAGGGRLTGA
jgi:peptidase C39-like protein